MIICFVRRVISYLLLHVFELWGIHGYDILLRSVACWHILWLKRGSKWYMSISIFSIYMPDVCLRCVCVILHLLCIYACLSVVAFILQLFLVCVDVVTDVATS